MFGRRKDKADNEAVTSEDLFDDCCLALAISNLDEMIDAHQ